MSETEQSAFPLVNQLPAYRSKRSTEDSRFKGTYGFSSAKIAIDLARQESGRARSVYALLQVEGPMRDTDELTGRRALPVFPVSPPLGEEAPADLLEFRRQFLLD